MHKLVYYISWQSGECENCRVAVSAVTQFSRSQRMQLLAMYLLAPCLTSSAEACIHWSIAPLKLQQKPYDSGSKLQRRMLITRDEKASI